MKVDFSVEGLAREEWTFLHDYSPFFLSSGSLISFSNQSGPFLNFEDHFIPPAHMPIEVLFHILEEASTGIWTSLPNCDHGWVLSCQIGIMCIVVCLILSSSRGLQCTPLCLPWIYICEIYSFHFFFPI